MPGWVVGGLDSKGDIQSKVHTNPQAREQEPRMLYRVQAALLVDRLALDLQAPLSVSCFPY